MKLKMKSKSKIKLWLEYSDFAPGVALVIFLLAFGLACWAIEWASAPYDGMPITTPTKSKSHGLKPVNLVPVIKPRFVP